MRICAAFAALALLAVPTIARADSRIVRPAPYAVRDLGTLPAGHNATGFAVNASGMVAGTSSSGADEAQHAFLWDGSAMRDLGVLPGKASSWGNDLNDAGHVVGASATLTAVENRAFLWDGTAMRDLGALAEGTSVGTGINNHDVVVGSAPVGPSDEHGFIWEDGTIRDLNDVLPVPTGATIRSGSRIDDAGHIIGRMELPSGELVSYRYDGTKVDAIRLEPGDFSDATGFSGSNVVGSSYGSNSRRAFGWVDGTAIELRPLPGDGCAGAQDVNARGDVVGLSSTCGRSPNRAVLWQGGRPADLQALIGPDTGLTLGGAFAINDAGQITGYAETADGSHAVLLTPADAVGIDAGPDAVGTAIAVSQHGQRTILDGAVIAAVGATPDQMVGARLAAQRHGPLLLTPTAGLDGRVETELARTIFPGARVELVGGTGVLAPAVENRLRELGYQVERHGGADLFDTAVLVAQAMGSPGAVFLADGRSAIDAAAAAPAAAVERAALLYTDGTRMPLATAAYLEGRPGWPRYAIGGPAAAADQGATPIVGRYAVNTAVMVAERFFPTPPAFLLAGLGRMPDAATGAALAARIGSPLLWTESARLSPATEAFLRPRADRIAGGWIVGGPAAVAPSVAGQAATAIG